jgi:aspartate aminotransferase-like enzyme
MADVTARLRQLYRTDRADILLMTSSGTGGLESAIQNCFSPGDEVFVPLAGFFADRWRRLAEAYGLVVHGIEEEWGTRLDPAKVADAMAAHPVKAVLLTQSETSTGVIQPVEALARVANDAGAMVVVDVVSSLGAVPFAFDAWGIDVAVGGSQKALSASPGIAFVAVSERAWAASDVATNPRFYFDWRIYRRFAQLPHPENPWTPAISVMQGLAAALELYFQDGLEGAMRRHQLLSRAVKDGVRALGLDLFGEGLDDNWTVTAIRAPEGLDADTISDRIRSDFGCVIAPGQGPLKGKVFRIGHFGYFSELDIVRGLAALEMTLERLGYPVKRGAAVAAAEQVFQEAVTA